MEQEALYETVGKLIYGWTRCQVLLQQLLARREGAAAQEGAAIDAVEADTQVFGSHYRELIEVQRGRVPDEELESAVRTVGMFSARLLALLDRTAEGGRRS